MSSVSRRQFLAFGAAASAAPLLHVPAFAQQCVTGGMPFLPNMLTVDCASRRNFSVFRKNTQYLGLTGVVSMTSVRGKLGSYQAGNLFLFPWLKPKGASLGAGKVWNSVVPTSATAFQQASPIKPALPIDEHFCTYVLQAPQGSFIGFIIDEPYSDIEVKLGLYSNTKKLADGKPVGIDWASSNLNHPWFGGSRKIPANEICNGKAWRDLIANGLNLASVQAC